MGFAWGAPHSKGDETSLPPAAKGYFFVFVGEGPNRVFDEMKMYVPAQNRWHAIEPLPIAVVCVTGATAVSEPATKPWDQTVVCGRDNASFRVELCIPRP